MTVIAWDGGTLAGDKRACCAGQMMTVTKVFRVPVVSGSALVGVAGHGDKIGEFVDWVRRGMDVATYPKNEDAFTALVIMPDGEIRQYERTPYPIVVEELSHTIGSGRDFALAAMALGKSAKEAVEFTARFDENCGNGVDALPFVEAKEESS